MALVLGDNFSYGGAKPLDARLKYSTVAEMKAVGDSTMYDGCLAYCSETEKTYQWKSTNTVDATLGRWREFETGGGGSSEDPNAYHTTDATSTVLTDTDCLPTLLVSSSSVKRKTTWSNIKAKLKEYFDTIYDLNRRDIPFYATSSTGATTTAKVATVSRGTFSLVAGAKVTVKFTYANTAEVVSLNVSSTGAKTVKTISAEGSVDTPTKWWGARDVVTFIYDGTYWIMQPTVSMCGESLPVVGTMSKSDLYSTTEKVVGMWTDGRPIYQKVITVTMPNATNGTETTGTPVSVGATVLKYISVVGFAQTSGYTFAFGTYRINNARNIYLIANDNSASDNKNTIMPYSSYASFNGITVPVVVQYTKTTDAANSYNYANENDYSTSEKIVGTWINGKPVYQKTISITLPTCTTDGTEVNASFEIGASIDVVVDARVLYVQDGKWLPLFNNGGSTSKFTRFLVQSNSYSTVAERNKIRIGNASKNANGCTGYATIQYTKT